MREHDRGQVLDFSVLFCENAPGRNAVSGVRRAVHLVADGLPELISHSDLGIRICLPQAWMSR